VGLSGSASLMRHVSFMSHVSVKVLRPGHLRSPLMIGLHIPVPGWLICWHILLSRSSIVCMSLLSYCTIHPSPCTLGQQVTTLLLCRIITRVTYCSVTPIVSIVQTVASSYTIVSDYDSSQYHMLTLVV
jgi:hypothetical protein